ncbi:hypothetical protein Cni_G23552 [Canna indica]|uniref:Coiled-coil domain-containing protein 137 n=1 Tax=Canna indica TaxID=4628 RepID=A0AAQ3KYR7_9LILI|nr:hypothetical protein Cni_G23552 [Canna indica]
MGGKGQRRREKNYQAAHGGEKRLPPAPNHKEIEAIPSKLRKIMELKNNSFSSVKPGPAPIPKDAGNEKRKPESTADKKKKLNTKNVPSPDSSSTIRKDSQEMKDKRINGENAMTTSNVDNERKRKRKKKAAKDLRFEELDKTTGVSRKKKRKEYLEAKKKKNKKPKSEDVPDFPGREEIKFGEIVKAPPKLSLPKRSTKSPLDVYHERVRLEAIEAYRNQRGWKSRPGVQIPMPENPST